MTTKIFLFLKKEHSPDVVLATQHSKTKLYKTTSTEKDREDVATQSLQTHSKLLSSPRPFLNRAEAPPGPLGKARGLGSSPLLRPRRPQVTRCQT